MRKTVTLLMIFVMLLSLSVSAAADTFGYADPESGITLQIPKGWKIAAEEDYIRFEAGSKTPPMTYRYEDMWDALSRADRDQITRQEFNNDIMSKADVADLLDTKTKAVEILELNGTEYFSVTTSITKGFFIFKSTSYTTSLIHFCNGYMHLFQFEDSREHKNYPEFEEMVAGAIYDAAEKDTESAITEPTIPETTAAVITEEDIYRDAVTAYECGQFLEAQQLFECVPAYEDAQDYLRLIRIRDYGSNTGIGCVYNFNKALEDFMKKDIDKAAERFYFADTAQVLLCNTDVACYYLFGNWITGPGAPTYAYFKLHKDASGGYYYTRSTNLSKAVSDCVSIIDGDVRISITSSNTLVFHIELTAPDCMDIYSYETRKSFTLYRN